MRSITQRSLPIPDPLGVLRLAILGRDAALAERLAVLAAVIRTVGKQRLWPELAVSAGRRDPIDQCQQLVMSLWYAA